MRLVGARSTSNRAGAIAPGRDPRNCGACGKVCAAGLVWARSHCVASCGPGLTDCSGTCADLLTHNQHCGKCGNGCGNGAHCRGGVCLCSGAQRRCGNVCADINVDPQHCGDCSTVCLPGQSCRAGRCA